jgi:hypothetical protein
MLEEYADALRFGRDEMAAADPESEEPGSGAGPGVNAAAGIGARAIKELEEANKVLQERLAEAIQRAGPMVLGRD